MNGDITITIRPMTGKQIEKARGKNVWGFCRHDAYNKFFIAYDKEMSTADIILTLTHEFCHALCGMFATPWGRKNKTEETFCDGVGLYAKLMFSWYHNEREQG